MVQIWIIFKGLNIDQLFNDIDNDILYYSKFPSLVCSFDCIRIPFQTLKNDQIPSRNYLGFRNILFKKWPDKR